MHFMAIMNHNDEADDTREGLVEHRGDVLLAEPKTRTKRPPFFKVILLNDDYTPMDFVVYVLKDIFRRTHEDALGIMLQVHSQGAGECGVFTRDVAETKAELTITLARRNDYPLQCVVEKA
jgi:ATP-dependent Clp protease adaptor protein ClpS